MKKMHREIFTYNDKIGFHFVPNINARIINEDGGYFVKTNSLGFRSDIEFIEKKQEKLRIIFLGDSNTAADGVSNNERFSDIVGEYFNAEVYNFALSGSGTDQQYLIWEEFAKKIEADLIVFGILVENIERNKVAFRETISHYTQQSVLTPKPYFDFCNGKLKLNNSPVPKINNFRKGIEPDLVQWGVPRGQEFLYKLIDILRNSKIFNPIRNNLDYLLKRLRSQLIKIAYQPYKDYGDPRSRGYILMKQIVNKFISSVSKTPVFIMPIPTFHYYADGAKPIFKNLFNSFNFPSKNIYVLDLLDYLKTINYNKRQLLCFKNDKSHFSKFGHKIISRYLIDMISKNQILSNLSSLDTKNKNNIITKNPIYILGISSFYHDSAAALIKDGEIVAAAQEERFSRLKNDSKFPLSAINFCLEKANINQSDLNAIVYYDNPYLTLERVLWSFAKSAPSSREPWLNSMSSWVRYKFFIKQLIRDKLKYNGKIFQNLHHRSHCAAAFYPSPFKKAAILTIDGVGEWATSSIGLGEGNRISMIKEILYPNSLGLLYSAFTQFTGFKVNSGEYKMMGLAPYGKPIYVDTILDNLIIINDDGSIKVNQDYFSYLSGSQMTNKYFADLFGGPARIPESKITQREMDIACSIQKVTELVVIKMARYAKELTGAEFLCMAGGVALNCVANGRLLKEKIFKDIWIQPAAGDAGSSLGAALDFYHMFYDGKRQVYKDFKYSEWNSYLGPQWSNEEIKGFLNTQDIKYCKMKNSERASIIANYLNQGKVVGHFSGRTEFGPRALGARSILGDARSQEMQTNINLKIKYRESFRPFAPTVLSSRASDYFELEQTSPYMLFVAPVRENRRIAFERGNTENMLELVRKSRSDIPAITHIDYSARIQTIDKENHPKYYNIIKEFEKITGYGLIINTSFNIRGEPIVNSPIDAYRCFMNTNMDVLILEDFLLLKNQQPKKDNQSWWIQTKHSKTTKEKNNKLEKELYKLYFNMFIPASEIINKQSIIENHQSTYWVDCKSQNNIDIIFKEKTSSNHLDYNSHKLAEEIMSSWYSKEHSVIFKPLIIELLNMTKKYPVLEEINSKVSDKIYEMF
jgi:carbamoyltransferase